MSGGEGLYVFDVTDPMEPLQTFQVSCKKMNKNKAKKQNEKELTTATTAVDARQCALNADETELALAAGRYFYRYSIVNCTGGKMIDLFLFHFPFFIPFPFHSFPITAVNRRQHHWH
jgi:hypothetical protein